MLSLPHLAILFIIALLVFGPEKLPELARMLGKAMAEFRRVTYDVRKVVEDEMREMEHQTREADLRKREAALAAEKEKAGLPAAPPEPPIEQEPSIHAPDGTVSTEPPNSFLDGKPLPPSAAEQLGVSVAPPDSEDASNPKHAVNSENENDADSSPS
jgi:TatA/E family protein of Tat protein translocase